MDPKSLQTWLPLLVIAVVFAGIVAYLVRLDRQLSKVEKEVKQKTVDRKTSV